MTVADRLLDKAHEYELNAAAAQERGEVDAANGFHAIEIVLRELAEVFEDDDLEHAA